MTESSGRGEGSNGGNSWERRAAGLASEVQRWLIRTSARNVRDELGEQVRKTFLGQEAEPADVWGTATTEPPRSADEAPECTWCPVCRAARRIAEARSGAGGGSGSVLSDAADVMTAAVKEVFAGLDSVLSYRPGDAAAPPADSAAPPADSAAPPADSAAPPADSAAPPAGSAAPPAGSADEPADDQPKGSEHGPDHRS